MGHFFNGHSSDASSAAARLFEKKTALMIIVALAAALRMVSFYQAVSGPAASVHRAAHTDMAFFDTWAKDIAAGDYLAARALHPFNLWQERIAKSYFERNPAVLEKLKVLPGGNNKDAARALWNEWYGGRRFHQEPLYPYIIAATYRLAGDDVRWVFALQLIAGVAACALVYMAALRYFGPRAAFAAGIMAALCGPLIFYETTLLRSSLITFTGLALLLVAQRAVDSQRTRDWFIAGVLLGLAILLKSSFILFAAGVAAVLFYRLHRNYKTFAVLCAAMTAGALAALSPAVARNAAAGAPIFSLSSVGAITFVCSNTEDYSPDIGISFPCSIRHTPRIMGESGGQFLPAALLTLRTHKSASSYLKLVWKKFLDAWRWDEKPNNVNFYYFRKGSSVLRYAPVTFFIIGPLSIIGLAFSIPMARRLALPYLLTASLLAPMLIFYSLSRFRAPMMAALIPFAAYGLVKLVEMARAKPATGATIAAAFTAFSLLPFRAPVIRFSDFAMGQFEHYEPMIHEALNEGDTSRLTEIYRESLFFEPPIGPANPPKNMDGLKTALLFSDIRRRYASVLRETGQTAGAEAQISRARELESMAGK